MASRSTNTLSELLQRWAQDGGQAMVSLPDEDASIISQLIATFRQILQDKAANAVQQQQQMNAGGSAGAAMGGMGSMASGPSGPPPAGVAPGMGRGPSADELQRVLTIGQ